MTQHPFSYTLDFRRQEDNSANQATYRIPRVPFSETNIRVAENEVGWRAALLAWSRKLQPGIRDRVQWSKSQVPWKVFKRADMNLILWHCYGTSIVMGQAFCVTEGIYKM